MTVGAAPINKQHVLYTPVLCRTKHDVYTFVQASLLNDSNTSGTFDIMKAISPETNQR